MHPEKAHLAAAAKQLDMKVWHMAHTLPRLIRHYVQDPHLQSRVVSKLRGAKLMLLLLILCHRAHTSLTKAMYHSLSSCNTGTLWLMIRMWTIELNIIPYMIYGALQFQEQKCQRLVDICHEVLIPIVCNKDKDCLHCPCCTGASESWCIPSSLSVSCL